jgi:hypothetical protein
MEEPAGFGIRYIWNAQADGPALQSGIKSKEYVTPYRPIIVSLEGKRKKGHHWRSLIKG